MEVRSNCRCCTAGCGIVAEVTDGRIESVRGDVEHPLSRGYLCPKGHALPWSHNRETRLDFPMIDGRRVTWPEMLDDLAGRIRAIVDAHGGNAIGWYEGNGTATDKLGKDAIIALLTGLGSTQDYSAATIDIAPAWRMAQLATGSHKLLPRWVPEDPDSRLAIWLGGNPSVSHGYMTSLPDPVRRIRNFRKRGGVLWVVDPRRTKTASIADQHLAIRPAADHILLAHLLRHVLDTRPPSEDFLVSTDEHQRRLIRAAVDPFTAEFTAQHADLALDDLEALRADIDRVGRLAVISGTGLIFQRHAIENEWLRWMLLLATDSLDQPGGMWFNPLWLEAFDLLEKPLPDPVEWLPRAESRPDLTRVMGELPITAMADEITAGNLRALVVNGGNPVSAFPDPEASRDLMQKLDLLIVVDVSATATTEIATHVLPAAGQLERMDYIPSAWAMASPAVIAPEAERKPTWWVAAQLGKRLGVDLFDGEDPDRLSDVELMRRALATGRQDAGDLLAGGAHGIRVPSPVRYMRDTVLPNGRWNILPDEIRDRLDWLARGGTAGTAVGARTPSDFTFINGRQLGRNCSMDFVPDEKSRDRALAVVHPDDMAALGVSDGEEVTVIGLDGSVRLPIRGDASIVRGAVWIPQGWLQHNVSRLCSYTRDVDPLTGQPAMTGLPVRLQPVG